MSLSSFLQRQAETRFDGRIPASERHFIDEVRSAERAMSAELGSVGQARSNLTFAWLEVADRGAEYRHLARYEPAAADGVRRAATAAARAELIRALEWLDDCNAALRDALRQEAARQEARGPA